MDKNGFLTSEFWKTVLGVILTLATNMGVISQQDASTAMGAAVQLASSVVTLWTIGKLIVAYVQSRTAVKTALAGLAAAAAAIEKGAPPTEAPTAQPPKPRPTRVAMTSIAVLFALGVAGGTLGGPSASPAGAYQAPPPPAPVPVVPPPVPAPVVPVALEVTMPESVAIPVNRLGGVSIKGNGKKTKWKLPPVKDLDFFREYTDDPSEIKLRIQGYTAGVYWLSAATVAGDDMSELRLCQVIIEGPTPPPPPPGPGPGPGPPPGPGPLPAGTHLFVTIVYGSDTQTPELAALITSPTLRKSLGDAGHTFHAYPASSFTMTDPAMGFVDRVKAAGTPCLFLQIDSPDKTVRGKMVPADKAIPLPKDEAGILDLVRKAVGG